MYVGRVTNIWKKPKRSKTTESDKPTPHPVLTTVHSPNPNPSPYPNPNFNPISNPNSNPNLNHNPYPEPHPSSNPLLTYII